MKTNIYISILFCFCLGFSSCYEDKGNYDYTKISEVLISKIDESYTRIAYQDTLRIVPEVNLENSAEPFTYVWTIRSQQATKTEKADTIGTERMLTYPVNLRQGYYDVSLIITDYRNLEKVYQTVLQVETQFSRGFYVLKEIDGQTELDLHLSDNSTATGLIEKSIGHAMPGQPNTLGFKFDYCYLNPVTGSYDFVNVLTVCTNHDALILKVEDMSKVYDHSTLFYGEVPTDEPGYIYCHPWGIGYISSQGHYLTQQPPASMSTKRGSGKLGLPGEISGGCKPDLHLINCGNSYYSYFYDQLNRRLLTCDDYGVLTAFEEYGYYEVTASPNDIPYRMEYFGKNSIGETFTGFAIFKDENQNSKYYIYEIDMNLTYDYDFSNPIMSVQEIPADYKFNTADHFAINEQGARIIWFTAGNRLYQYDIDAGMEKPLSPANLPADEEITFISNRFWTQANDAENNFNYLAIATQKNGNYKIYLYPLLGGELLGAPQRILSGKGKAVMMQYMSPRMVQESYAEYPGSLY